MADERESGPAPGPSPGPGVDRFGTPVYDPSKNVDALVGAAIRRQDDLRTAESGHIRELIKTRAEYDEQLRGAGRHERDMVVAYEEKLRIQETARIDAIRAVDVGAVNRAAEVAATQAGALAAQLIATAEASRVQVAAAASASVTSLAAALEPIQKDIRDLRDAQSRGQGGKDQVVTTSTADRDLVSIEQARLQAAQARMQMIALVIAAVVLALGIYGAFHK